MPVHSRDDRQSLPPLSITNAQHGYISGYVSYPLSAQQRNEGVFGYEENEWRGITHSQGGAARYPLRDNHRHDIGHLLETSVLRGADGRAMLGVSAMVDLKSDAGRRAWADVGSGRYKHFSWKFEAYEPAEPRNRRYKNKLVEVSLTDDPVKDEACVVVVCSKRARLEETMSTETPVAATPLAVADDAQPKTTSSTITTSSLSSAAAAVEQSEPVRRTITPTLSQPAQQPSEPAPAINDMLGFVNTSRKLNTEELVKLAAEKYRQAEDSARRNADLERQNKELMEKAEELNKIRAEQHETLVKKHREHASVVLPMLKEAGMDLDNPMQRKVVEELVTSVHCSELWKSLEQMAHNSLEAREKVRKVEEERRLAEEDRKRSDDEAKRAHRYLEMLQPSTSSLTDTAMRSGVKRQIPLGSTTVQCSNKKVLEESTASLLGLDKLNRTAYDNARTTTQSAPTHVPIPIPAATAASSPVAAVSAPAGEQTAADFEQEPEVRLPENLMDKLAVLRDMLVNEAQGVRYPIPVACSKEESQSITYADNHTLLAKVASVPWEFYAWAVGSKSDRQQVREAVERWGGYWQPFNYDSEGNRCIAGTEKKTQTRLPQNWLPDFVY